MHPRTRFLPHACTREPGIQGTCISSALRVNDLPLFNELVLSCLAALEAPILSSLLIIYQNEIEGRNRFRFQLDLTKMSVKRDRLNHIEPFII